MGENSAISWTTHSFNPWTGCAKISPGCANCYAEREMERFGKAKWGTDEPRVRTATSTWNQPRRWNRAAIAASRRDRVFCASWSDVCDPAAPIAWFADLLDLIHDCQGLDWLLLTKRPHLFLERLEQASYLLEGEHGRPDRPAAAMVDTWRRNPPPHVWVGTTVEDQARAEERLPHLLRIPAAVRFLSCEPLLGRLDLGAFVSREIAVTDDALDAPDGELVNGMRRSGDRWAREQYIHWVIVGGESGPKARPMHPAWVQGIRDQCQAARIPFWFKQWGEWVTTPPTAGELARPADLTPGPARWPTWQGDAYGVQIGSPPPAQILRHVGRKAAGDHLDGQLVQELPASPAAAAGTAA